MKAPSWEQHSSTSLVCHGQAGGAGGQHPKQLLSQDSPKKRIIPSKLVPAVAKAPWEELHPSGQVLGVTSQLPKNAETRTQHTRNSLLGFPSSLPLRSLFNHEAEKD